MVKGLVSAPDGSDLFISVSGDAAPLPAGGVVGADSVGLGIPFGLVELVVVHGLHAGTVHRLEVGHHRVGPAEQGDVDVVLPVSEPFSIEVTCGATVFVDDEVVPWAIGRRRAIGGLDLSLRWCAGPSRGGPGRPVLGLPLADVLLDRLGGSVPPPTAATWELGRTHSRGIDGPLLALEMARHPLLTVTGAHRHAAARAVLGRLVAACWPERLRLTVLAPAERATADVSEWAWTRWLPHARTGDERVVRVGVDDEACARLAAEVATAREGVLDVVVIDDAAAEPPHVTRPGLGVLMLQESPPVSAAGVVLDAAGPRGSVHGPTGPAAALGVDLDLPDAAWIDRLARSMSTFEGRSATRGRLADLLGHAPDDVAAYAENWSRPATTRVPIGWGEAREGSAPVLIDLQADGPHALIGGTTGSGKSELLLTLVASLAAANPPEAMTFLLVDYKGGAAFGDCARLPHTVGVVTDLDVTLTARALASLSAEVRRREHLLAEVGATDIDAYLATGRGPLARLVIMVDEFATLAAELPDFVDGLVDIARRGRSLGLHLVLATQRPGGAVSADIRANTTLRISLRVAEPADSADVIGVPDAVAIGEAEAGRALIRVGQNDPVPLQTARVTTSVHADLPEGVPYVFGQPLPEAADRTDLARMAEAMTALAANRGIALPDSPWLPALPEHIAPGEIDLVAGEDAAVPVDSEVRDDATAVIPFGVEDRPAEQRRAVAHLSLSEGVPLAVIGGSRSGRSSALLAIAASACERFSADDLHIYAVDAGARGLGALHGSPHVGAVVFRDEPDRLERLLARLGDELDRRVQMAATQRWRSVAEQRAADPEAAWPYVIVLVDRWDLLTDAAEAADDRGHVSTLERLATEGGRLGILVVATGDRGLLTGRMTSLFPDRLVLRLADVYDYASIGALGPAGRGRPGRGWRGSDCIETQIVHVDAADPVGAAPALFGGRSPFERSDGRSGAGPGSGSPSGSGSRGPFRIDTVPSYVTRAEAAALPVFEAVPESALLVAVGGDHLQQRWIDVAEYGPCALVTGRRRSGRSGVLATLAESGLGLSRAADAAPEVALPSAADSGVATESNRASNSDSGAEPWEVVLVLARRSPLSALVGASPRVHGPFRDDEDAPRLAAAVEAILARGHRALVLADDIDLLPDGELLDELGRLPGRLRDTTSFFVGAGEAEEIVASFRGPAAALRRSRCGVMLSPQGVEDGDAFGVRLRRGQVGRALGPGAGMLVLDGLAERVQVIRSGLLPEPTR